MSITAINMSFTSAQQNHKPKFNSVKYTGYGAVALGLASGIAASQKKIKMHKYFAYAAGLMTLAHIGIVEYFSFKRKKGV